MSGIMEVTHFPGGKIEISLDEAGSTLAEALAAVGKRIDGKEVRVNGEVVDAETFVPEDGDKALVADKPQGN